MASALFNTKVSKSGGMSGGGRNIPLCNVSGGEGRSRIDVTSTKHHQKLASTCSNITNSNLPRLSLHQKYHIWWYIFISKVTFEACKISTSKIRLSRPWMTDRGQILFFGTWHITCFWKSHWGRQLQGVNWQNNFGFGTRLQMRPLFHIWYHIW